MNPDGHVRPRKASFTIDDLFKMGFISYREGQSVFDEGKFERPVNDRRTQTRLTNNRVDRSFHRRKM